MALGTVKWFDNMKGFGFISRGGDDQDVFVHYSVIDGAGWRTLKQGQAVEFDEYRGPNGLFATRVLAIATPTSSTAARRR